MGIFAWLTRSVKAACWQGFSEFAAELAEQQQTQGTAPLQLPLIAMPTIAVAEEEESVKRGRKTA